MVELHVALAWAAPVAVPVVGPVADERAAVARWEQALSLVDLHVGVPGSSGPAVWIEAGEPRWTVRVRDERGDERSMSVAPPRDQAAREAVAFLAASLLQPVVEVPLPPAPASPPSSPSRSAPRPRSRPSEPDVEPEPLPPLVLTPPEVWIPEPRVPWVPAGRLVMAPPADLPRGWVAVGLGLAARRGVRSLPQLEVRAGWHPSEWVGAMGGLQLGLPAALPPVEEGRTVQAVRGWVAGAVTWRGWSASGGPGVAWRQFAEPAAPVVRAWIPDVHIALGRTVEVRTLAVRVRVELTHDLVPIDLVVGDEPPQRFAPATVGLGVTLGTRASGHREDMLRR